MATFRIWAGALWRRGLVLEHPVWSWAVIAEAVARATSYVYRPPEGSAITPTTARIEGTLTYDQWAVVTLAFAAMIVVGTLRRWDRLGWTGHLLGLGVVGTLALTILLAAIFDGAGWSASLPLVVVGLVHLGRVNALGPRVRETTEQRKTDRPTPRSLWGGRRRD